MAIKKARGERVGGVPYGRRVAENGSLSDDAGEQVAVELARRLRADGRSLRQIGAALVAAGHQPRSGRKWHVQVLARVVTGTTQERR